MSIYVDIKLSIPSLTHWWNGVGSLPVYPTKGSPERDQPPSPATCDSVIRNLTAFCLSPWRTLPRKSGRKQCFSLVSLIIWRFLPMKTIQPPRGLTQSPGHWVRSPPLWCSHKSFRRSRSPTSGVVIHGWKVRELNGWLGTDLIWTSSTNLEDVPTTHWLIRITTGWVAWVAKGNPQLPGRKFHATFGPKKQLAIWIQNLPKPAGEHGMGNVIGFSEKPVYPTKHGWRKKKWMEIGLWWLWNHWYDYVTMSLYKREPTDLHGCYK